MRADTKGKYDVGKRFAILIGVAAACVMALGAQTATSSTGEAVILPTDVPNPGFPGLELWGKGAKQKLGKPVKVNVGCGDEACTVRATGGVYWWFEKCRWPPARSASHEDPCLKHDKLRSASADVGPGETTQLKLKLKKKTRKAARKVLNNRGKNAPEWSPSAEVFVIATDAAGNEGVAEGTVKLVK
jgi:hypothetical protein